MPTILLPAGLTATIKYMNCPDKYGPKVSVIILNWNGCADTLDCLSSVARIDYPNFDVAVVDNGSTDDSIERIQEKFPAVTLLPTHKNLGYAGGNNFGIRHALETGTDYILILNNDTIVAQDILKAFVQAAETTPSGAAFGAKIYFYAEPYRIWCVGGEWSNEMVRLQLVGYGQTDDADRFDHVAEVEIVVGCAFFIRANTLRTIGLFDEKFFLVHEESDWCFRAKTLGYKCFFIPKAKVWHKVATSFGGQMSPVIHYFNTRNTLLWAERHVPFRQRIAVYRRFASEIGRNFRELFPQVVVPRDFNAGLLRTLYWASLAYINDLRKRWENNRGFLEAELLGLADYCLRRFGDCPRSVRLLQKQF